MTETAGRPFHIVREVEVNGTPAQVWEAITTGTGAWLWPMEYEPRKGGAAPFGGVVAEWDPPRRLIGRVDGDNGWFNEVDTTIKETADGRAWVRYVHSGVFADDWDNQYDGASQHTDFYLHTLGQYVEFFAGRPVEYVSVDAPASSVIPDGLERLAAALGLPADAAIGDPVRLRADELGVIDGVLDYRNQYFIGVRTPEAMYRFFGRNAFGAPVNVAVHDFGSGTPMATQQELWQAVFGSVFG
jgi:uncharacterized protein YndB with AHSA1/START domain